MNARLPVFLTAYDPAELPGGTLDPLGFTGGYLALADALFPGMTAAAAQATYFPMLCAGLWIAESQGALAGLTAAEARKRRIDVAQRFERLWALAGALQVEPDAMEDGARVGWRDKSKTAGLRGVRYVNHEVRRLVAARAKQAGTQFRLLAEQYRYGAFGIYAGVAEQLRLLEKSTLAPTHGFGAELGRSFLETTADAEQRKEILRASQQAAAKVRLSTLRVWGAKAHPGALLQGQARALLSEAIVGHRPRARMLELLEGVAKDWQGEWWERVFFERCLSEASETADGELISALHAALAYDAFLRSVTLIFERVLWLCRTMNDAAESRAIFADPVIVEACGGLPVRAAALLATFERLSIALKRDFLTRGRGILQVAQNLSSEGEVESRVRIVFGRHRVTQSGKLERGRPKQVFVEERGTELVLTNTDIGNRLREPTLPEDIRGPDWRVSAGLSMLTVTGRLPQPEPA